MTTARNSSISRLCAVLLFLGLTGLANGQQTAEAPLTNNSIIKLVRAGFKEKSVIAIVHSRVSHFNLDTEQLIQLKHNGVSENIILAMLSVGDGVFATGGDWNDDSFFKGGNNKSSDADTSDSQNGGTGIFGSSGGSRSQSRSRGGRGASEGESTTTGSATVRILRPPTEGGAAALKLEKTPTLDNEAIIRLVDAGFSEGTILKRIEDSPGEFDLSPAKLEELHKRRVTDSIIGAMSAAMGDKESQTKPSAPLNNRER